MNFRLGKRNQRMQEETLALNCIRPIVVSQLLY